MKRRKKYDSPVVLQQAEVLLELAFLQNSGWEAGQVVQDSAIQSGSSNLGEDVSYGVSDWD